MLDLDAQLRFYRHHLFAEVLPFWLNNAIDREHGGYYTCFANRGDRRVSTDKYVWSQGRFVWVLAKLAGLEADLPDADRRRFLDLARSGVEFLAAHCLLENGNCAFLLDEQGRKKEAVPGKGYDTSIFVDCFVILGFSEYARRTADPAVLDFALRLYDSVLARLADGGYRTEPYPIPAGYRIHGIPMILLNTSQELAETLARLSHPRAADVDARATGCMRDILAHFVQPDHSLLEMLATDNTPIDSLLGRYVNPGHTIEDMWFIMHQAAHIGDAAVTARAAAVIRRAFEIGWDREHGGLLLFVSPDGGRPTGKTAGLEECVMLQKVRDDWESKLWWPHSEALYATLLAYEQTGDAAFLDLYRQSFEYTFRVFPNPDKRVGEWIQIRDRRGQPVDKVVALPVKDPYHITRNLILVIELLARMTGNAAGEASPRA